MYDKPTNGREQSRFTSTSSGSPNVATDPGTTETRHSFRLSGLIGNRPVLTGLVLFGLTAASVVYYPGSGWTADDTRLPAEIANAVRQPTTLPINDRPLVEVVFVLDTTGSMGGLIQAAKDKIWSIASSMAAAEPAPEIRIGLVGYRDRGDQYVTQLVDLSSDLDSVYAAGLAHIIPEPTSVSLAMLALSSLGLACWRSRLR